MCVSDTKNVGFRLYKDKPLDAAVINILDNISPNTTVKDYIVSTILAYHELCNNDSEQEKIFDALSAIQKDTAKIFEKLQTMSLASCNVDNTVGNDESVVSTDANTSKELNADAMDVLSFFGSY